MKRQFILLGVLGMGEALGCSSGADGMSESSFDAVQSESNASAGEKHFDKAVGGSNGRACGTCHIKGEHRALHPATVEAKLAANPSDPLFNAIDADNPSASPLTYNNLRHGLVRVKLKLPDNVDLLQIPPDSVIFAPSGAAAAWWAANVVPGSHLGDSLPAGMLPEIITPADRMVEVWRSVPSVDNTAYSGRFLFDGRAGTLQDQAVGALEGHSAVMHTVGNGILNSIADFERTQFSSSRAQSVFDALIAQANVQCAPLFNADGSTNLAVVNNVPKPETTDPAFATGNDVYERFCTACHGKATDDRVENETVRAQLFVDTDHNGNVKFQTIAPGVSVPVAASRPGNEFLNIGTSLITYTAAVTRSLPPGQAFPSFNSDANFPRYRVRFYTNAARTVQVTDLPPLIVHDPNNPFGPLVNPDGTLTVGPNFAPENWSPDPGRAFITGDPADFEGINIPQLRGIANTAPYFHDNSQATLAQLIDTYSQFILPFLPPLNPLGVQPGQHAMTATQRADLLTFLSHF